MHVPAVAIRLCTLWFIWTHDHIFSQYPFTALLSKEILSRLISHQKQYATDLRTTCSLLFSNSHSTSLTFTSCYAVHLAFSHVSVSRNMHVFACVISIALNSKMFHSWDKFTAFAAAVCAQTKWISLRAWAPGKNWWTLLTFIVTTVCV